MAAVRTAPSTQARRLRPWQADLFAVAITAATFWLRFAISDQLANEPALVLFTVPIMASAYLGGLRSGLISTALAYLGASYFLLPPYHSFGIASGSARWLQMFVVLAGIVISALNEALHRSRRRLLKQEAETQRVTRLYAALSQVNQAIVWTPQRDQLFRKVCEVLVAHGGFHLAWIGWHDPATHSIRPLATCGNDEGVFQKQEIFVDGRAGSSSAVATAFREQRPCISNEVLKDPVTQSQRAQFEQLGIHATAVFPIREGGTVGGVIVVCADEPDFFQDKEIALLTEAAVDVSFALDNFAREAGRQRMVEELKTSEGRLRAYVDQAADYLFEHDATGRLLDVNRTGLRESRLHARGVAGAQSVRRGDQLRPAAGAGGVEPDDPGTALHARRAPAAQGRLHLRCGSPAGLLRPRG